MSRADVAARDLIDRFGYTDLPIDPEKVARELGVLVVRDSGDARLSGMLLRRDGQMAIGLNPKHSATGQRFALAHLLGHFRMHRGRELILDTVDRYSYGNLPSMPTDREEAEANRFAGALLAPEAVVRRMAAEARFDTAAQLVGILAGRFELSPAVMSYRLMSLGIVMDA
jgi:Zn-dependent peptidase ImmA (M78 family)